MKPVCNHSDVQTLNSRSVSVLGSLVERMLSVPGTVGGAVVDIDTGQTLRSGGAVSAEVLEIAGIANARLLRSKIGFARDHYHQRLEDIVITLSDDYHIIRLICRPDGNAASFLYLVLDRVSATLALAKRKLIEIERDLTQSHEESRLFVIECDTILDTDFSHSIETLIEDPESHIADSADWDDEIPAFMRTDVALTLLGIPRTPFPIKEGLEIHPVAAA